MITKILLTLLVILTAYALIKRQRANDSKQASKQDTAANKNDDMSFTATDLRLGAYMFIAIMFMLGGYFYYQSWQQDHQLLTIRLYPAGSPQTVEYQVFRYQLDNRSFITTDGIQVKVSDSERMEVLGLEPDK